MLKQYKNQLFDIIRRSELDFEQFVYDQEKSDLFSISYRDSPFQFHIGISEDSHDRFDFSRTLFAPGYPTSDPFPHEGYFDFGTLLNNVKQWINDINRYIEEIEEIDLWDEYNKGNDSLNIEKIEFNDQVQFNTEEKVQVRMALNEFQSLILQKFELSESQISIVSDRIEHLCDLSEDLTKFDWKGVAISTLISITIALSLDTEGGKQLIELFKQVFSAIKLISV
ncbi:MAG: hypothetical protein HRT58_21885 [Crocinitomicaceae bacterium]|nr:hypothetical protein [Flavobacteriales bacterium]NQZ38326.1 hypothetical protein [Crocinitomicaceae bacterium]